MWNTDKSPDLYVIDVQPNFKFYNEFYWIGPRVVKRIGSANTDKLNFGNFWDFTLDCTGLTNPLATCM